MSTDKGVISFQITYPTPDATDSIKERFHVVGVVEDLENIADRYLLAVPAHILTMVASAFYQQDQYRVELVEGLTSYKFYRRPSRELWPKEQSGTALEAYQKANPGVRVACGNGRKCTDVNRCMRQGTCMDPEVKINPEAEECPLGHQCNEIDSCGDCPNIERK